MVLANGVAYPLDTRPLFLAADFSDRVQEPGQPRVSGLGIVHGLSGSAVCRRKRRRRHRRRRSRTRPDYIHPIDNARTPPGQFFTLSSYDLLTFCAWQLFASHDFSTKLMPFHISMRQGRAALLMLTLKKPEYTNQPNSLSLCLLLSLSLFLCFPFSFSTCYSQYIPQFRTYEIFELFLLY